MTELLTREESRDAAHDGSGGSEAVSRDSVHASRRKVVLKPTRGFRFGLRDLWEYRELLYFMAWRDIKVRYKQTLLGGSWAVLQPLLLTIVFTVILGTRLDIPTGGVDYAIFAFAGLLPWTLFSQSLITGSNSLVISSNLISKIYFPRLVLPVAAVGSFLLDFVVAFVLLGAMMAWYGVEASWTLLLVVPLMLFAATVSLSVSIWLSAMNVRYRDIRYAVPFIVQLWLFVTPVVYPANLLDEPGRTILGLNPMTGVVEGFRWAALGIGDAPGVLMLLSGGVTLLLLIGGLIYFHRTERTFADVI